MSATGRKVALVTGGSRGIGAAIARRLAEDGADVALTYVRSADKAQAVVAEIEAAGGAASPSPPTTPTPPPSSAPSTKTVATFGRLDILVNNAGIFRPARSRT